MLSRDVRCCAEARTARGGAKLARIVVSPGHSAGHGPTSEAVSARGRWRHCDDAKARPAHRLAEAVSTHAGPEERAVAVELAERLRAALAQLPDRQAEVFCLHAMCGWSYRELGERMRMTDSAVGVTIHRARQRLRTLLDDDR